MVSWWIARGNLSDPRSEVSRAASSASQLRRCADSSAMVWHYVWPNLQPTVLLEKGWRKNTTITVTIITTNTSSSSQQEQLLPLFMTLRPSSSKWAIIAALSALACRRKFGSQTSDKMHRWKAEMGRVSEEKRREEKRRKKIKKEKVSEERRSRCAKR